MVAHVALMELVIALWDSLEIVVFLHVSQFYYICYIHIVTSIWQEISTHEHMHVYRFMLSEWRNALVNMYACMYKIIHE